MRTNARLFRLWALAALMLAVGCPGTSADDDDSVPTVEHVYSREGASALTWNMRFPGLDYEVLEGPPPTATGGANAPTLVRSGGSSGTASTLVVPGQTGTMSWDYQVPTPGPLDLIIYFDGAGSYIVIHLDLTGGSVNGTIEIPFSLDADVCDALYAVQHAIQCNETIQGLGGEVADYLVQLLSLQCGQGGDDDDMGDDDDTADDDDMGDDDDACGTCYSWMDWFYNKCDGWSDTSCACSAFVEFGDSCCESGMADDCGVAGGECKTGWGACVGD